jgi:hypothetical protein
MRTQAYTSFEVLMPLRPQNFTPPTVEGPKGLPHLEKDVHQLRWATKLKRESKNSDFLGF